MFGLVSVLLQLSIFIVRIVSLFRIVGKKINNLRNVKNLKPFVNSENTQIISSIIYIDHFGNVVTNIKKSFFDKIGKGRKFEISARNYKFNQIYSSYSDIINFNLTEDKRNDEGKALIIFNTNYAILNTII